MTKGKAGWQCVTVGCGRAKHRGDLCDACARRKSEPPALKAPKVPPAPKAEIKPRIYPTGETRWLDGRQEMEITDGQQRWWVSTQEEAA